MSIKSLNNIKKYYFSKTICVVAGGPHMDLVGSQIIKTIKQTSPDTRFIGIGGAQMLNAGLEQSYADVNKFLNKPLYPYKSFKHKHIERPVHPVYGFYHAANRKVRDQVDKTTFFKDIIDIKPDAFLCLQNDFFMNRLYNFLNEIYDFNNLVKPPVFHYDRTHINQRQEFTEWLDHQFSVNPIQQVNFRNYVFPSTVVGHEGVGRAWQYLYQQSDEFGQYQSDKHIYLSPEHNQEIIETLVQQERMRFRSSAGLNDGQFVILFSPGNTQNDINFSVKALKGGIKQFLDRPENLNIDKSHYVLAVNCPDNELQQVIESKVKALQLPIQTVFTTQKYSAMAGSDAGIVYNGEAVSECAAMQLPCMVIENMPFAQHYYMQMYNHWNCELNIATGGEQFQELIGTNCTSFRISEELYAMTDPKYRYYLAQKLAPTLYHMVPRSLDTTENAITNQKDHTFIKHGYTYQTMAGKILRAAGVYSTSEKHVPHYKLGDARSGVISNAQLA